MTPGKSALTAVHSAVYAALKDDPALNGRVFDFVPADPLFPYVRIGDLIEESSDTMGQQGRSVSLIAHVWSTYEGLSEAYGLADRVIALLRYQPLTMTGWRHEDTVHVRTEVDEPTLVDAIQVQHVSVEFNVLVREAA